MAFKLLACCILGFCVATPGSALAEENQVGPQAMPDADTIEVPVITGGRDAKIVKNGWKYFYFWRPDTSFAQAYADIADCYRFLSVTNANPSLPAFANWQGAQDTNLATNGGTSQYGLVGAALGAMVDGPIIRRASQSRMRRCLEPRGYQRFPADKETWERIVDGYSQASIAVKAKIASGPRPDAEPLPEDR